MKRLFLGLIMSIFCTFFSFSQQKQSALKMLDGVWIWDNYEDGKYGEDYVMYLYYSNNFRYKFDYHSQGINRVKSDNIDKTEICFIPDSLFRVYKKIDFDNEKIISLLQKQKKCLVSDVYIDYQSELNNTFNMHHLTKKGDDILTASIWKYTFFDKNNFIIAGYGFNSGQPQNGFSFSKCENVPLEIVNIIKKIKDNLFKKINAQKSLIYSTPNTPTKMYLLKNDEVEILEEKGEWLMVRFYGKKTIEGWIKKSDIE